MHTLIVAPKGTGKSALIRRLLDGVDAPVFGFETVKEDALTADERGAPIYIYPAGGPRERSAENLLGYCVAGSPTKLPGGFDRFAPRLAAPCPPGALILMDELGFMESQSPAFCAAVLARLDGDAPVLAAVRDLDVPFLEAVRSHPNCRCFRLTEDNADALYPEIRDFLAAQLAAAGEA